MPPNNYYHWTSDGYANDPLNQQLYGTPWPWLAGYSYFLLVTNYTSFTQNFSFTMSGQNAATDDYDGDGLPDAWELACWPSIYSYNGNDDPDHDGVSNMEEYLEGTSPCDPNSYHPRLLTTAIAGAVTRNPVGNATLTPPKVWYPLTTPVQLTATPNPGYSFISWTGDATGTANPLNIVMDTNKTINAVFGITNNSGADYRFQLNLASSVGTPPDLQNIGAGNTYVSEPVDTCSQLVLQFPLHNGVRLQPTASVIPTNIYTIVMLFRLDQTNSYRRLVDFKAGTSDFGLYVLNGALNFYPVVTAPASTIAAGTYVQVVLTRDGTNVIGYVNGVQQFTFADSSSYGVISGANDLRFFKDDTTSDDCSGAVSRIRLYANAMTPGQVSLLDRTTCGGVPYFLTPYYYTNALQLPVTSVIPGVAYRLLASTNLQSWTSILNFTPSVNSAILVDTTTTNYPYRFYRLVTP